MAMQHEIEPLVERAQIVYQLLGEAYGIREWYARREPLHELISTILSQRTNGANEEKAFQQLWAKYGSWEAIAAAPVEDITEAIAPSNYADQKAPRIKAVLQHIIDERGMADITFLADLPVDEALAWLRALPGVGPKTATLVLLFCFHKPVLPVDTHVHRVSQRVGLIGPRATAEQAHELLPRLLPHDATVLWNFHHNMLRHGQKICIWGTPRCSKCVLREHCDYYARVQAGNKPAQG
ncbi:MAG TPA: endonuclease III [Roseiflexaceae bacterium]|nr:endonuclease III [Roseiflexaceae bacterium]